ncbi:MAG: amino acid ABC transporter permease, partial [Chloroflexi bacterium]
MDFKPSVFFEALTSPAFIDGVRVTITLTVVAMAFGLALGLVVALLRASPWAPLRAAAW